MAQRVFGIALGYEDLNDHETLRHDPVFGVLIGKLAAQRRRCAALAGKSRLNRLELYPSSRISRYHKIVPRGEAIARLWVSSSLTHTVRRKGDLAEDYGSVAHEGARAGDFIGAVASRF